MKKIFTCLSIFTLFLSGCSSKTDNVQVSTPEPTEEVAEEQTAEEPAGFQEIVIADNEYLTMTITDVYWDSVFSLTFEVLFENNTTDKTITFITTDGYVNGFQSDPQLYLDLAPGKKGYDTISFWTVKDDARIESIDDVEIVEILINAHEEGNYYDDPYFEDTVTINFK